MNDLSQDILVNALFDDIQVGQTRSMSRTLLREDIEAYAAVTGDSNPSHLDAEFASHTALQEVVGHGMWVGGVISTLLGTRFPGPGTVYLGQSLKFLRPVYVNSTITPSSSLLMGHILSVLGKSPPEEKLVHVRFQLRPKY